MNLYYFRSPTGIANFGDELNPYLWPKLLKGENLNKENQLLVGIGTLLNNKLPKDKEKFVFGTGAGYGNPPIIDESFRFYCVRGPLTADRLGLDRNLAVTDSALLLKTILKPTNPEKKFKYAYMPHWQSCSSTLSNICSNIGLEYIDPRDDNIEKIVSKIQQTEILLTEAMHGAIIADAYRTPWIPIKSWDNILDFKWIDWCSTIEVEYRPQPTLVVWDKSRKAVFTSTKQYIKSKIIENQLRKVIKKSKPIISSSKIQDQLLERLLESMELLKYDMRRT